MKKIYKNKNTTYSTLRESSVILNEDTSEYLLLNEIAKYIFEILKDGETREQLKSKLEGIFDDPENKLELELNEFLDEAIQKKIIFEDFNDPS